MAKYHAETMRERAMSKSTASEHQQELPIIMIGAGGHAKVLLDLLDRIGRTVLFITDRDKSRHGQRVGSTEIRGDDGIILGYSPDKVRLVNAVGSIATLAARREVYTRFRAEGYYFETLVHPSAVISNSAQIGDGVQIMAGVIVQPGVQIGQNALINTAASIDHDCFIGAHVHVAPRATLSGQVSVGEGTHIGTAATIIQSIQIGCESLIGAGAVVIRDVPDGQKIAGVPARPMSDQCHVRSSSHGGMTKGESFTIMLSAAGRRVTLLKLIRQSIEQLGFVPRILATDIAHSSAALHFSDISRIVPQYSDPNCLEELIKLCQEFNIRLIVPTIDPDLPFFAEHRERFEAIGTRIMISSLEAIGICNDKKATHEWLVSKKFPTVRQIDADQLLQGQGDWSYPIFVKPRAGSSSVGAKIIQNLDDLRLTIHNGDYIAQQIAHGQEYTVDVYVDRQGRCRCAVPRLRIETRGGEVSKGMTVRCQPIEDIARQVAEALPGAVGVMNIQIFYDRTTGELNVIEINPRFGGGYPLSHQAGAHMTRWILEELTGRSLTIDDQQWKDGLLMLRYDQAVFLDSNNPDATGVIPSFDRGHFSPAGR